MRLAWIWITGLTLAAPAQEAPPEKTAQQWMAELLADDPAPTIAALVQLERAALPILSECMGAEELEVGWRALRVYAKLPETTHNEAGGALRAFARDPKASPDHRSLAILGLGALGRETKTVVDVLKEESFDRHHVCALLALQLTVDDAASACKTMWKKDATMRAVLAAVTLANAAPESKSAVSSLRSILSDRSAYLLYQVAAYGLEQADESAAVEKAMAKILKREKGGIRGGLLSNQLCQNGSECGALLGSLSGLSEERRDYWASCPRAFADFNGDGNFSGGEFYQGYVLHAAESVERWNELLIDEEFVSFAHFSEETQGLVNGLQALEIILDRLSKQR